MAAVGGRDGPGCFDLRVGLLVAVTYLGVVASAGTLVLWTYGAARLSATTAGAFTAAMPAVGYALAVLTGEEPNLLKLLAVRLPSSARSGHPGRTTPAAGGTS